MTITELVEKNHAAMVKKGFHQEEKNIGEVLMLIVSELGEAPMINLDDIPSQEGENVVDSE